MKIDNLNNIYKNAMITLDNLINSKLFNSIESYSFQHGKFLIRRNEKNYKGVLMYKDYSVISDIVNYKHIYFTGEAKQDVYNEIKSFINDKFGIVHIEFEC